MENNDHKDAMKRIKDNIENLYIIHYACEGFSENTDTLKIVAIAILHHQTKKITSFSIHLEAQKMQIDMDEIDHRYDEIEASMLQQFCRFMKNNENTIWLHWHMESEIYGFQAIERRYNTLNKQYQSMQPDNHKNFNLPMIISSKHGRGYAEHPRMEALFKLNGGLPESYLAGEHEAALFKQGQYCKIFRSTVSKVEMINNMYELFVSKKLITENQNLFRPLKFSGSLFWKLKSSDYLFLKILGGIVSLVAIVGAMYATLR